MCKKRIGQLLGLSLLALVLNACGQKGDLFLPESEEAEKAAAEEKAPEKEMPDERDPKDGPIMEKEKPAEQESAEPQGDQP
ncbi:LPS translocon maturation chaperone LptM [Kangiella koreensis]|uniref:Lipoprotein Lppl n=1 Tax=Kangiella koreensis (strain DSM 16069 / JCM 12317 / KCTC 12182 / SW-125) TaxID=523791 RepID=C7R6S9_KANKD|nr:lipoprotein [Kangiella koreensis]ACV25595.1 lipoprotein Lppl [Kangiella koreensis DSM 16069]